MSYEWITIAGIAFIFIMNTLGSLSVFAFRKGLNQKLQTVCFGFSGGIMIAASIWSLLLPAIEQTQSNGIVSFLIIPFGCIIGCIFLWALDRFSQYLQNKKTMSPQSPADIGMRTAIKLFLAVTLHNIPEGLAVGFAFGTAYLTGDVTGYTAALGLAIGIGVQNLPEGVAVSLPILREGKTAPQAFFYGFLSGAVEPLFAVIGYYLASILAVFQPWLLAVSAGAMLFVTVEELLPANSQETQRSIGAWSFMLGFLLMMVLDVIFG